MTGALRCELMSQIMLFTLRIPVTALHSQTRENLNEQKIEASARFHAMCVRPTPKLHPCRARDDACDDEGGEQRCGSGSSARSASTALLLQARPARHEDANIMLANLSPPTTSNLARCTARRVEQCTTTRLFREQNAGVR